jgi:hypothetical protein
MPRRPAPFIYQLKVSLKGAKPPIWRRVLVPSDMDLGRLHRVIQAAMGWMDYHLHQFVAGHTAFGVADENALNWDMDVEDERKWRLDEVLKREKDKLRYEYDFGDGWEHDVTLEKVLPYDAKQALPRCVAGRRACPPEDCGGIWGYAELLEVLADPEDPGRDEMLEWLGGEFDPSLLDLEETNRMLAQAAR